MDKTKIFNNPLFFTKVILYAVTICLLTSCSFGTYTINYNQNNKNDYVVVLHGIFIGNWQMDGLASYLADQGYEVINVNYPSTQYDLQTLTLIVRDDINKHITSDKPVHFVGFSMGGLILRALLKDYRPSQMGRVVYIATPNQGSEIADLVEDCPVYKLLFGPAGQQLITDQAEFKSLFGEVNYELGIISGYNGFGFPFSGEFSGLNDGKVSVESTLIAEAKDHIKVEGTHSLLPFKEQVHAKTLEFLNTGKFAR